MNINIKDSINHGPMRLFQFFAVAICCLISFIDGFDVMVVAFVAPSLTEAWNLQPEQIGALFSSGLAGMVIGALFISPFADRFGRRFLVLISLVILSIGMLACALSSSWSQLFMARVFTGLGMGAILPAINTVVAEYASNQYRSLAISVMAASYTVGSLVGSQISIFLINTLGWSYVFIFGCIFSAILIPLVIFQLPESLDFLLTRKNASALKKLNWLLARLNLPAQEKMPQNTGGNAEKTSKKESSLHDLLSPSFIKETLLLCTSYFMLMCSFYFLTQWTPKILVSLGYTKDISITGSTVMSFFGIIGGLLLGWLSKRIPVQVVTTVMLLIGFIAVVMFGFTNGPLILLFICIGFIGFAIFGAMAGLYATTPIVFPPAVRATGTGMVLGIGRLGATIGPYLAGVLIAAQWSKEHYFFALALPLCLSAICIWLLKNKK